MFCWSATEPRRARRFAILGRWYRRDWIQRGSRWGASRLASTSSIQSQFDISIRQNGTIYLASDDEEQTLLEELHEINKADDYASELWTAQQCRERYPQLRSDYCVGGLFFPDEVSVNPRTMIHRLHRFLADQPGFAASFGTTVTELDSDGQLVTAMTSGGTRVTANRAIVCCGSEFSLLFPQLFAASDLVATKLQMLRLKPQPNVTMPGNVLTGLSIRRYESFSQCPSWSDIKSREPADSFWKQWGVHILFKQEADGGIILGDSHEYASAAAADELGFDLRDDVSQYFVSEGRKIFDLPSWEIETAWYGVYCQTSDPSGIFTRTIDNNIHIATGIGGKGMTSSAGFAKKHLGEIYND